MPRLLSVSLLALLVLGACAPRAVVLPPPPPPLAPAPVPPRVEVRVYRELPEGPGTPWGTLSSETLAPAAPPEGPWFAEPVAPVRTEEEARALATLLRVHAVRRLSFM